MSFPADPNLESFPSRVDRCYDVDMFVDGKRIIHIDEEWLPPGDEFTEEEQLEQCCNELTGHVCGDTVLVESWSGASSDDMDFDPEALAIPYQKLYGERFLGVDLVGVGTCLDQESRYDLLACCDDPDIEELLWHTGSVPVVADNSYAWVAWEGGKGPYEVSVSGQGFYVDSVRRNTTFITPSNTCVIFAGKACGICQVTVKDACDDVVAGEVKSTNGTWSDHCYAMAWSSISGLWTPWYAEPVYNSDACFVGYLGLVSSSPAPIIKTGRRTVLYRYNGSGWTQISSHETHRTWDVPFNAVLGQVQIPVNPDLNSPPSSANTCPGRGEECSFIC